MKVFNFLTAVSLLFSFMTPVLAAAAPLPATAAAPAKADLLPAWMSHPSASQPATSSASAVLPAWMQQPASASVAAANPAATFPAWFASGPRKSGQPAPGARNQIFAEIPQSLLTVNVFGPPEDVNVGAPAGEGEIYTAIIRNNSSDTAYGVYLTATHQSFMIYDGASKLISRTGEITPLTFISTATTLQWAPVPTYNLAPGETITLTFRLRAGCNAQSGQRMEVGVNYNADPPPASPIETNTGGLNITTGRGNLVINKYPALQELGTGDFGKPITWTVEVQNTGLGKIYNAVITDTGGENLGQPGGDLTPTATIDVLDINEVVTYTVVGTVDACNFTNVAEAAWSCGNIEGDGYYTNPVTSTVSVLFNPDVPRVELAVSDPLTFSYCGADIHTVTITATDQGGVAGDLRIASNLANHGFLDILTGTIGGDWTYDDASGRFSYQGGSPTGTLMTGEAVTLTFQVQPNVDVCRAGSGSLTFAPLYREICADAPFTGTPQSLAYAYAQGEAPTLGVTKSGPSVVASGETFTYEITLSGSNAQNISGTIYVTDTLPTEFELQGDPIPSAGVAFTVANGVILWTFPSTHTPGTDFSETLIYQVKAITDTGGVCGAGRQVNNSVEAFAQPTCDACDDFTPTTQVETIIVNQEGVIPAQNAAGAFEVCGEQGFVITNRYEITGSTVVTWAGAAFTEALGTDIGGAGALGTVPLLYEEGSFSLAIAAMGSVTDYTHLVTPTVITPDGHLFVDLNPLHGVAPTQTFVLYITYTVGISETSLNQAVRQTFYNWTQLYLPNSLMDDICAGNAAYNQALELTIERGDLSVGLSPQTLHRCETNRAVIQVTDNITGALTNRIVVTFTSSTEEIETARNFATSGNLPPISAITVVTDLVNGLITFTFASDYDPTGNGTIEFDIDVGCYGEPPWRAGITYRSRCDFPHDDAATLSHDYLAPNLLLFVTPLRYTLREREATWKFFVTNNGNLTAYNVVVTNTASGLNIIGFDPDGDDITATLPAQTAVFTIDEIAPGQQRAVTVTAEAFSCTPLGVVIAAQLDCFDTVCGLSEKKIDFVRPKPYLRTNNGQTADLPMCDLGQVVFTTKNASPDVNLYWINITETLQQLTPDPGEPFTVTILDKDNKPVATTNNFDPIFGTVWGPGANAVTTTLEWFAHLAPTEVATWFQELPPLYTVRITVPVRISCVAPNVPTGRAAASAEETCGTRFSRSENAVTFQTKEPNLDVLKDGRVEGGEWGKTVYATPGQTVTWRLQVINPSGSRAHVAENVVLSDTWPIYFDFITATTSYTYHIQHATRTITWEVGNVALDETLTFYITGTVVATDTACSALTTNRTRLEFGCDDGCTHDETPVDFADMDGAPNLSVALDPDTFSICEGDIELTIRNEGARAYSTTLTVTMPSGYEVYTYTLGPDAPTPVSVTLLPDTAPEFYWDELPGRISADPYFFTMTLRVQNTGASGACPDIIPRTVTATLGYDDHAECDDKGPYDHESTASLIVGEPNLVVSKEPAYQTAAVGERVTWTLRVENVASGNTSPATNVVVTDVVGTNYITVVAGNGTNGTGPFTSTIAAGTLITWAPNDIAVDGVWTATVSAALDDTGDNRNVVTATAFCDTGCASAAGDASAHTTLLLEDFAKHPAVQTGTIGSLTVFTFAATLQDRDALYEDLTITDTLPDGLGYVSSTLVYTYAGPATPTPAISHTPTITPGYLASGDVVWQLGNLSGTVEIRGVITAVVRAIPENYDGMRWTNVLTLTYTDDVGNYVYTGTAAVDILEPLLHIGKTYVTPDGCAATLFEDNFNDGAAGWVAGSGTWSVVDGEYRTSTNGATRLAGSTTWTDYSVSAMLRSDATATGYSRPGLYLRYRDTGNFLRLRWINASTLQLQQNVEGVGVTPVQNYAVPFVANRWYHFEVQVVGNVASIWVDGAPLTPLAVFDARLASGQVGLYNVNVSSGGVRVARFDDVLVTRLDDMACTVGANDLVTYTLTISNQAQLPAYDLVITDVIPAGTSLLSYDIISNSAGTLTTTQPAPIPGATGALVWGFNYLTPTAPFNPLNHTYINLQVVLQVSDQITANIVLANQAFLVYDAWQGDDSAPVPEETRDYSGGSHSTAIRTVNGDIAKTVDFSPPPTATLGTLVTYTLIVPATPISATLYDVVVTDTLDARLRVQSVISSADAPGVVITNTSGLTNNLRFELSYVPHSTQAYITVTARISHEWPSAAGDANAGNIIYNTAEMTHSTATEITTTNEVSTTVGEPRLALVKASDPPTSNTVGARDAITYQVTITNTGHPSGPSPAYDIVFTDTLPGYANDVTPTLSSITLNSVAVDASLYITSYVAGVYTIVFSPTFAFSIPVGGVLVIRYVATVDDDVGAGLHLTNTAQVTWSSLPGATPGDRDYGPEEDDTTLHTVLPGIGKAVAPPTATLGSVITYTLRVPDPAITATLYNVTVTDRLSDVLQLHAVITDGVVGDVSISGNAFTVTYASIPHGQQRLITVTAVLSDPLDAHAGDSITNVATLRHDTGVTITEEVTVAVVEPALEIVKASDPPTSNTVGAGETVTYTVRITNASGITASAAYDIVFTDTLPVGMRAATPVLTVSLNAAPVSSSEYVTGYTSTTGVFTVTFTPAFSIPVGGVLVLEYIAAVDNDVQANIDLTNLAEVSWSSLPGDTPGDRDYDPITDTTTLHTPIPAIDKGVVPPTVTIGSQVVYTITVPEPLIPAMLYNVIVTDVVDSRLRVDAVSSNATFSGQVVTATFASIFTNTQRTIVITATVRDLLTVTDGTQIPNVAVFDYDGNPGGPVPTDPVTVTVAEPDVSLRKTVQTPRDPNDPLGAGDLVTYTLTLSNTGNWPAYDLVVTDSLPLGLDFVGDLGATVTDPVTATTGGEYPVYTATQLNVGGYWYITFTARVRDDITAGVTLTNAAWGVYDGQPGENDDEREYDIPTDTVPVNVGYPALDLVKFADPSPVEAGGLLTYTLTVTNTGIVSATGVLITDTIPENTTFVTATLPHTGPTPNTGPGSVLTWTLATLDIGAPRTVTMTVQVDDPLPDGTILTNTAWVTSTEGITDTDTITTEVDSSHTLAITKTASPSPVQAGGVLTYTLAWSVSGNQTALGVMISDTVPVSTTYQDCGGGDACGEASGLITWTLGNQDPGANGTVTFTVLVDSPLISGTVIHNAALISDTQGVTDTDEITTPVESAHTLSVRKTVTPSVVSPDGLITYTLAYTIAGNEPVYNVTLSDTTPAHTTFYTATPIPDSDPDVGNAGLVTWALGDFLPPGSGETQATGVVTLVVRANTPLPDGLAIVNTVVITDASGQSDEDTVTNTVESWHTLALTKTADPAVVQAGDLLTYTLEWAVSGNEPALGVTISDTVPLNTAFDSCDGGLTCGESGGLVTWELGDQNPPASGVVTLVVQVDTPLLTGTVLSNAALITDTQGLTDTDTVDTPVESAHTLALTKTAEPAVVQAGDLLTYTLAWSVDGNEPALGVTISDTVPLNTAFDSCDGGLTCGESGGLVTWDLGDQNPPASGVVTLVVQVDTPLLTGTVLSNAALITDTQGFTDTDIVDTPVESAHTLAITKTAEPAVVQAGDLLTYTLEWAVSGNEPALGVTISDTVPANTAFDSCSGGLTCGESGSLVTWGLGDQNPPASGVVTLVVQVDTPLLTGTVLSNAALITDTQGITDTDTVDTPVESAHTLALTKTAEPAVVQAGDLLTYTLAWSVDGNEPALGVTISDTVPANTAFDSCSGGLTCGESGGLVTWDLGDQNPPASGVVTLVVQVDTPLLTGTVLSNAALITDTQGITDTDTVDTPVESAHTLALTKTAEPAVVQAGDLLTYTLEWAVSGNEPALSVTISDTVPLNTAFDSCDGGLTCGESGGLVTWELGDQNPPASGVVTLVVQVDTPLLTGTVLSNAALITDTQGLTDTDTVDTPVESAHTLALTKTAEPAVVQAGDLLTYTLAWSVDGNEPALGVTISDTVPQSTTFWAAIPPATFAPPVGDGGTVLWTLGDQDPPVSGAVTLVVRVDSNAPAGTLLYNAASITDTQGLTDTGEITTPVNTSVEIWVTKTGSASPVTPGEPMTYSLTITNDGPSDAENVVVTDTLPAEVTFVDADPAPDSGPNPLVWDLGTLTPGESRDIVITVTVNASVTAGFTNTVIITTTTPGDDPGNNEDDHPVEPLPDVEIWVTKTGSASPVTPGEPMTYSLTITNDGPSDAENVFVTDTLPAEVTFVSASPTPDSGPNPLVWNLGTLTPGESRDILITVTVNADVTAGFTNTVLITTTTPGDDPGNNEDDHPVEPLPDVEIWVTKTGSASPVTPGEAMTYSLTITNDGPSDAQNVVVTDTLPVEVTFLDAVPSPNISAVNPLVWNLGTLAAGESRDILITVTVNADVTAGFTNTVIITTTTPGDDPGNNEDDHPVDVTPDVEIWVAKTGSASPVTPGAPMTYSLTITNAGPSNAENVVVTDTLPAEVAFVSANPPQASGPNPLVWTLGTLTPGERRDILITVTINADVTEGFTNTVVITTTTPGDDPGNNEDDHPVDVVARADLAITKSDSPDPVVPGETLIYTLVYTNYGPSDAENVVVTDTLPAEVTFVSASPAPDSEPNPLVWNLGTVAAGDSGQIVITVTVNSDVTAPFTNTVVITSDTPDDNPDDNTDEESTQPLVPGMELVKTVLPGAAVPNMPFTYVIAITNTGYVTLDPLILTDTLPSLDFHYVAGSATPSEPAVIAPPLLLWPDLGPLEPGASISVTFAVTVTPGLTLGTYVNVALATGDHPGGVLTDTDDVPIVIEDPAIALSKHLIGFDTDVWAPNFVTFTIAITNVGLSEIDILPLYDLYDPFYLHFASAFPAMPDTVDNVNGQVVWFDLTSPSPYGFGRNLLPGEVFSITTVFTVVNEITSPVTNTAVVSDAIDVYDNPTPEEEDEEVIIDIPTAVDLLYFRAVALSEGIRLEWATAVEIDNFGFTLHRATEPDFTRASEIVFIPSACRGNLCGATYDYLDTVADPDAVYWYWLVDVDTSGVTTRHGPVSGRVSGAAWPIRVFLPLVLRNR